VDLEAELQLAKQGDRDALGVLLFHFQPRLLGLIRSRLSNGLRGHAEDILQEALLNVVQRGISRTVTGIDEFETWLNTVAINALLDRIRYLQAQRRSDGHTQALDGDVLDHHDGPYRAARRAELMKVIENLLPTLAPEDRTLLEMQYLQGLSLAEMGKQLGCNEGTVRVRCHRLRKRLEDRLGDVGNLLSN
jgi:RNA polymerase sigma factor (sigma-70 family)